MRRLSYSEIVNVAAPTFHAMFNSYNAFGELFTDLLPCRGIVYPIISQLLPDELSALIAAASAVGDGSFFMSVTSTGDPFNPDSQYGNLHWYNPLSDPVAYLKAHGTPFILENALYSPSRQWAMLISYEDIALVTGTHVFLDTLYSNLSNSQDQQLTDYLTDRKRYGVGKVLPLEPLQRQLSHIYGDDKAQKLLENAGF